jgi:hypothetical protein
MSCVNVSYQDDRPELVTAVRSSYQGSMITNAARGLRQEGYHSHKARTTEEVSQQTGTSSSLFRIPGDTWVSYLS